MSVTMKQDIVSNADGFLKLRDAGQKTIVSAEMFLKPDRFVKMVRTDKFVMIFLKERFVLNVQREKFVTPILKGREFATLLEEGVYAI